MYLNNDELVRFPDPHNTVRQSIDPVSDSKHVQNGVFSSPEHEVLMVSYCDQSLSVVRRASCVVRRQQFVLKANSS